MQRRLTDEQWQQIEQILLGKAGDRGRSGRDNRRFVDAVLWVARTGSFWCDLPMEYGKSNTVYQRFVRWSRAGVWNRVFDTLGREPRFQTTYGDSDIVRRHRPSNDAWCDLSRWAFQSSSAEPPHPSPDRRTI